MIIKNKYIPLKGFKAIALWPFILVRKGCIFEQKDLNHERIHHAQQKELLIVGFYVIYSILWFIHRYDNHPMEKEAYSHEKDMFYLSKRKHFAWLFNQQHIN